MRRNERGITLIGWLLLLVPLAIVAYAGLRIPPARIAKAALSVGQSHAYSSNAELKQQILDDHAESFAAMRDDDDGTGIVA